MKTPLEPLSLYEATIKPEWLDYNGHMNETYYLLIASKATDELIDHIGMDEVFRQQYQRTIYTLETHILYLKEVGLGETVKAQTQLLGLDNKRVHIMHALVHAESFELLSTVEMMLLNIDKTGPRATAFEPGPKATLERIFEQHRLLPVPSRAGRHISPLKAR